eukprot:TRINITY_DN5613_c0_g1_i19.p5 TRINITY_DN5613_c0_g1~~TRINITY_DN5613_c0_g1_i19.p5  ORF type:complete len:100 (-),score=0.03 TRINITY_DN5613_c0_g1_i19:588-887(-)
MLSQNLELQKLQLHVLKIRCNDYTQVQNFCATFSCQSLKLLFVFYRHMSTTLKVKNYRQIAKSQNQMTCLLLDVTSVCNAFLYSRSFANKQVFTTEMFF